MLTQFWEKGLNCEIKRGNASFLYYLAKSQNCEMLTWHCKKSQNSVSLTFFLRIASVYTILPKVLGHPLLMKGLCIRQESKRNDDSVSVEELDWSAERQVLIPAEHLWCDFKYRPWAKNSSPNTNDLYIHYMDKSTGTPPSLEEKKALPNCGNKDGNIINVLKIFIFTSVATVLKCMKGLHPYVRVIGDEFLAQGLYLKSHQRCSAGIRTCLSADQSSSSTLTESSFLFDPCLIHRVMLE